MDHEFHETQTRTQEAKENSEGHHSVVEMDESEGVRKQITLPPC